MGVFDYLDDGTDRYVQVKCFEREMRTYRVGDVVPRMGDYSIALLEGGWANVFNGQLISFTDDPCYLEQIDKWGRPYDPERRSPLVEALDERFRDEEHHPHD